MGRKTITKWIILIAAVISIWGITALPHPLFPKNESMVVTDEAGRILRVYINNEQQWKFPTDKSTIPEKLKKAVITFEDKRYYIHSGVDTPAVVRAVMQNMSAGRVKSGGSTLTMQLARLVKPKDRNIINKAAEALQALKLELYFTKEEILKMYLENAPYGTNIVGYRAASMRYFGKIPSELTWAEAAALAILPNSPSLINPVRGQKKLKAKRDRLLEKLYNEKAIDKETFSLAVSEKIPAGIYPFSLSAPHLADKLKKKYGSGYIKTTIIKEYQDAINKITQNFMQDANRFGIRNCAVVVAETKTGKVRTYIGSNNYFDMENGGMIDGVKAPNSTGSILKPFLYALAMDEGMIVPETKVEDIPTYYKAYFPFNANMKFKGLVKASEALTNSLNIPAVRLLDKYGLEKYYEFLKESGMTTLVREPKEYGLSLILGGAEANLWDMVSMYRGLGNYGEFSGIYVADSEKPKEKQRLISKGAGYLTLNILKDLKRPGGEYNYRKYSSQYEISWKTGTSFGNLDAWAVGVSPQWTIGIWLGNFDGKENKNLSGIDAAAPLFFEIFNYLPKDKYSSWFQKPEKELKEIEISAETGYKATENTINKVWTYAPRKAKPLISCPYEKELYTNKAETEEVCSLCWDNDDVKKTIRIVYPPDVVQYMKERGNRNYSALPHKKGCPAASVKGSLGFIYPSDNSSIIIPKGAGGRYETVIIQAANNNEDSRLFWHVDGVYSGETIDIHKKEFNFENGKHKILINNENGDEKEIEFFTEKR